MDILKNVKGCVRSKGKTVFLALLLTYIYSVSYGQVGIPKIRSVALHNGLVEIEWEPSSTLGIAEYRIQYAKYAGGDYAVMTDLLLPFMDGSTTSVSFNPKDYISDTEVDVENAPVAFAVKAFVSSTVYSDTDIERIPKPWDSTLFLSATFDACLAEIQLDWTPYDYNMWTFGVKEYQVMVSEDGGAFFNAATVASGATSYALTDLVANSDYRIYIAAVADTTTLDRSTSFVVEVKTEMEVLPDYIYADFATFDNDRINIRFSIDPQSELGKFNLLRAGSDGVFDSIAQLEPTSNFVAYADKVDYKMGPYFYKLDGINYCGNNIVSSENMASAILLKQTNEDPLSPEIAWNNYKDWTNGVAYYSVQRKIGNQPYEEVEQTSSTTFSDLDIEDMKGKGSPSKICYTVTAFEQSNPYGEDAQSQSNEICIELPVNVSIDYNAFTPGSDNDNNGFGPTMDFIPDEFEFSILNRAGQVVFNTTDANNARWDGKHNGKYVSQGAYMYILKYRVGDAKPEVLREGLSVVYP